MDDSKQLKAKATRDSSLDLRIRLFSDGGTLFLHLMDIENGSARNSRAVQMMHLGLMIETGRLGVAVGASRDAPTANAATFNAPSCAVQSGETKGIAASDSTLDLRIRLFSDGGTLFPHLKAIENGSARNSRAVQLMNLGLMIEMGRLGMAVGVSREAPAANATTFNLSNSRHHRSCKPTQRKEKS